MWRQENRELPRNSTHTKDAKSIGVKLGSWITKVKMEHIFGDLSNSSRDEKRITWKILGCSSHLAKTLLILSY